MSGTPAQPQHDHLVAAARELSATYGTNLKPPRAISAWAHLPDILNWIDRLPEACRTIEPQETKAAEWLLDNQYQIKRTVRQIHEDLPAAYYKRLPGLDDPTRGGLPRVFCVAQAYFGTTQIQLSLAGLIQFVRAFQESTPLLIAELWALPTMLRLVCLEILITASARAIPGLKAPFEDQPCAHLSDLHEPTECIARALTTLRVISSIPWKDFFEQTSLVEEMLLNDPAQIYARMDFETRDSYRKIVEELARHGDQTEWDIASHVLVRTHSAPEGSRLKHVGYWLHDEGRSRIEAFQKYRPSLGARVIRFVLRHAGMSYAIALTGLGMAALLIPAAYLWVAGASWPILAGGMALCLVPASIISITIVHWVITLILPPRVLPKLDFENGVAPDCKTAVVVPVILRSTEEVSTLIERLELHWLSNSDPLVQMALLSDPKDASTQRTTEDGPVETALVEGIRELNARYKSAGHGPFHLLHRSRSFNPSENCWMAWERKRGKLEQFNGFILGELTDAFPLQEGETDILRTCRFVVTVDADTILPQGAVARLIGTLAHPLNAPEIDQNTGRLCAGYTIIQPRVEISPESGSRSPFSHYYGGDSAIDIYSRAVSNVYQDLFGSASYVGKGIYEVASFQRSLHSRIAENSLLSHDLFEGAHGRVALASDIVLYDSFPTGYVEYIRRWHRWVRGDWQLLPWLAGRVPTSGEQKIANEFSGLDRWKIFDNLRRSIIPLALVALAVAGWLALPGNPWVWTALTIAAPGAYLFTDVITGLARGRRRGAIRSTFRKLSSHAGRWLFALIFLLHDALVSLDAIARTLWRLVISRRFLLTWTSAAHSAVRLAGVSVRRTAWREMWVASSISAILAVILYMANPSALVPASALLLLWFIAPEVAIWISRPHLPNASAAIEQSDRAFLRAVARRTWLFFESFVGPNDNWLPPDNFQDAPHAEIAHRTSPTNIGMYLLSTLTAWDLGFIDTSNFAARIENSLNTLDRLERHRGHFLNWYDTSDLTALEPRYVSTVDSGNLAVCLVTLGEGCREAANAPVMTASQWDGLTDTLAQLADALQGLLSEKNDGPLQLLQKFTKRIARVRDQPKDWYAALTDVTGDKWHELNMAIQQAITPPDHPSPETLEAVDLWLERAKHHLDAMQRIFGALLPWLVLCEVPPEDCRETALKIKELLSPTLSASELEACFAGALALLQPSSGKPSQSPDVTRWVTELTASIEQGKNAARGLRRLLIDNADRSETMAYEMDFLPLYDSESRLFHIGYNASSDRLDPHYYDLLATEARLASYFAVAKKDVPTEHWFYLGRPIARPSGEPSLLSWNGSMFEYLMPSIFLRGLPETLLARSERSAVDVQRHYARMRDTPWGISESAYAARDSRHLYQYQAFGVPGLGLRRGLTRDLVVAPYASALALAVCPREAVQNLEELANLDLMSTYGFMEAADFTPERIPAGQKFLPVRAYMAHHQGMILAAIGNALRDDIHVSRFTRDMQIRAASLLLQERVPWELPPDVASQENFLEADMPSHPKPAPYPWRPRNADLVPQMHMLGNGRLASWISDTGSGALRWHAQALTRWLPDATCDDHGLWVYIRDKDSDSVWSVGRQPTGVGATDGQVIFHPHMAEFHRRDDGIGIRMEVGVAPGDDIEFRRITVVNESDHTRRLRVVSYGEVVLSPSREDERHPSFSKLFVGSEHLLSPDGLLFTRRPRDLGEHPAVLFHRAIFDDREPPTMRFETDRSAFLGRNSDLQRPAGIVNGLSGTSDWTLDPIMALELDFVLKPRETRQFAFLTLAAGSRESVLELAERYATLASLEWALNDSAREATREARVLDLEPERLPEFQSLSSLLLAPQARMRAPTKHFEAKPLGQPHLWAFGISGDLPILLFRMSNAGDADILRRLLRAHKLWRNRLFAVDLVILRTGMSGYEEPIRERALALIRETKSQEMMGQNGGIHLLFADHITVEDRSLIAAAACVVLDDTGGSLDQQLGKAFEARTPPPRFEPVSEPSEFPMKPIARPENLQFDNGLGGFSEDGTEYVIHLQPGEHTPAPWCNILANDEFGTLVTEAGSAFTWAINSGENRLTPWSNDSLLDPPSEVLYLRDEETAETWTPTPAPNGSVTAHQIRHGPGYTKWLSHSHGLEHELTIFVAAHAPVKIARLRLRNVKPTVRRITATYYAEWLLGAQRSISRHHVVSWYDADSRALLARNPWNPDFGARVAFLTSSHPPHSITTDRRDFVGRAGNLIKPAGLEQWNLGERVAPEGEPCAAFQVHVDLSAGGSEELVFVLGQGRDQAHAKEILGKWRKSEMVDHALTEVRTHWNDLLCGIEVQTPDPAFDLMVNRWLQYQTISSRIKARAGPYQASGAIGFRDQLQDVLALLHCDPTRVRAHILDCAARQFEEGDVLHWWHPPQGRGVRTRCSDDLLWLPYVTSRYVCATGDLSILDAQVPFLTAPELTSEENDRYAFFERTSERYSLFEHCQRAVQRGVTRGAHQLPLIGAGDWNDGMNRVGMNGRGESVWLGWFAIATMNGFADLAKRLDRMELAEDWKTRASDLEKAIARSAWDGKWYLRAIDDDGHPWGSESCEECKIDSISQSWAALSGSSVTPRTHMALTAVERELVREEDRLVRLLWPPFHETHRDPGYIKAYPPGVRENGGQYSHAAAWYGFALATLGEGDGAWKIFDLINPIRRSASKSDAQRYRVEPYVLSADVLSVPPHTGRGGWTWYTGAAAWSWRLAVEGILGLQFREGGVNINPNLPKEWGKVQVKINGRTGSLAISIENPDHLEGNLSTIVVDGMALDDRTIHFPSDGTTRSLRVQLKRRHDGP